VPWRCRECGSSNVEPDDGDPHDRFSVDAVRQRLLDPETADRSLASDDDRIAIAFRVLVVVSMVALAVAVVLLLV